MAISSSSLQAKSALWDLATGHLLQVLDEYSEYWDIWSVDFSPDGTRLVTGSVDGKVMVWDPATGLTVGSQMKLPCVVVDVKFNPDGTLIAAGCADSTTHLLDVSTGDELFILPGYHAGFSPDGKYLITEGTDGITHGFYLGVNDLIGLAKQRLFRWWTPDECQKYLHTQTCPPAS